jgi:hypothetical protein
MQFCIKNFRPESAQVRKFSYENWLSPRLSSKAIETLTQAGDLALLEHDPALQLRDSAGLAPASHLPRLGTHVKNYSITQPL